MHTVTCRVSSPLVMQVMLSSLPHHPLLHGVCGGVCLYFLTLHALPPWTDANDSAELSTANRPQTLVTINFFYEQRHLSFIGVNKLNQALAPTILFSVNEVRILSLKTRPLEKTVSLFHRESHLAYKHVSFHQL